MFFYIVIFLTLWNRWPWYSCWCTVW